MDVETFHETIGRTEISIEILTVPAILQEIEAAAPGSAICISRTCRLPHPVHVGGAVKTCRIGDERLGGLVQLGRGWMRPSRRPTATRGIWRALRPEGIGAPRANGRP